MPTFPKSRRFCVQTKHSLVFILTGGERKWRTERVGLGDEVSPGLEKDTEHDDEADLLDDDVREKVVDELVVEAEAVLVGGGGVRVLGDLVHRVRLVGLRRLRSGNVLHRLRDFIEGVP